MGEEKNGVQNGTPNGEMAPQEDSSKMPLTEGVDPPVEIAKAADRDSKIDMPTEAFKGLTKDELMQYAKEPFWVRLRIFLMALFWLGWMAMLGLAIFIIIQAPRCEPPPSITWLQESPMLEVDISKTQPKDAVSLMTTMGLSSAYIPLLISDHDYYKLNPDYVAEHVISMLESISAGSFKSVTDFVPNPILPNHPWALNDSYSDVLETGSRTLDYSSNLTSSELLNVFRHWKSTYNVTGFLVPADELKQHEELRNLTAKLNLELEADEIVIGEAALDISDILNNLNIPGTFKQFLLDNINSEDWIYYKYNPVSKEHSTASPKKMPAVTLSLMLLPGTPILQIAENNVTTELSDLVKKCVDLRHNAAIKFGETQFVNTTDNVVAYTRTLKGTPGYAVVVNLGLEDEVVDFSSLKFVPDVGTLQYNLTGTDRPDGKPKMNAVHVTGHGGLVLQFVAKYD